MKNSVISSEKATPPPGGAPSLARSRKAFALTGRSVVLDPMHHAVRGDLADVRLADRVFAPHYAAPLACRVARPVALTAARDEAAAVLADLDVGEAFDVLELAGTKAWGIVPDRGLVGYVDRDALGRADA